MLDNEHNAAKARDAAETTEDNKLHDSGDLGRREGSTPPRPSPAPPVTFQAPAVQFLPPEIDDVPPPAPASSTSSADSGSRDADVSGRSDDSDETGRRRRRRRGGRRRNKSGADDATSEAAESQTDAEDAADDDAAKSEAARAEAKAGAGERPSESSDASEDADADHEDDEDDDVGEEATEQDEGSANGTTEAPATTGSRRRRRRRRRRGEPIEAAPDDPETTIVKVREPRKPDDEVSALEGSTRLEAKRQRRREGREAGRRRPPILSEAEFLARRESVERTMVIRQQGDRTQIAVLEDDVLVEHYVTRETQTSLIGNVYLGRVQNVLPSMEAAFVDIGRGRNAVLYAGEVDWNGLGLEGQPKRIETALQSGQTVLVQVTKDPVGHKGARLTSQISIPGRYLVYVPHGSMSGISRKLPDTERNRLKSLLKDIVPEEAGVVVRTAAEGASEEELSRDVARLRAQWQEIERKAATGEAPNLLYAEPDLLIKVVRDLFTEDFSRLVVSGDHAWDMVEGYVTHVAPHLADRLERWTTPKDIFASFRIDEQIVKALDRKVWLPSGGSLIIERTEAMTVIDVNTGKFTGAGGNLEETVTKNNLEAAEEIVRQLRLRDIGGIIVIDFIDMVLESNRDLVLRRLVECLGRDRTKHQVAEVTSLGLVQMTRKRIGTGLLEAFSEPCDSCNGRGYHVRLEPLDGGDSGSESEGRRGRRGRRRRNVPPVVDTTEPDIEIEPAGKAGKSGNAGAQSGDARPADAAGAGSPAKATGEDTPATPGAQPTEAQPAPQPVAQPSGPQEAPQGSPQGSGEAGPPAVSTAAPQAASGSSEAGEASGPSPVDNAKPLSPTPSPPESGVSPSPEPDNSG